jgi:hypothetical protein
VGFAGISMPLSTGSRRNVGISLNSPRLILFCARSVFKLLSSIVICFKKGHLEDLIKGQG